jgi:formylglycine-generating enzyme required for sulfatase activity
MRRVLPRRGLPGVVLLAIAFSASGCFPDYSVDTGPGAGGTGGNDEMKLIPSKDKELKSSINYENNAPIAYSATFTHDFEMDVHEVTVGDFREWVENEADQFEAPCDGCTLDPGGPYENSMIWHSAWDDVATSPFYTKTNDDCTGIPAADYGPLVTWELDDDDLPMTCVPWPQAVAYCKAQGKRLPTEVEWLFAAGAGTRKYPWGEIWEGCDQATINYDAAANPAGECAFPVAVGTGGGATPEGVEDLGGSVFEWVWDKAWEQPSDWPNDAENYSGPVVSAALGQGHFRNGGAYWSKPEAENLKNDVFEGRSDTEVFWDDGFRCVRTVPNE